jgi:hypothetical protein
MKPQPTHSFVLKCGPIILFADIKDTAVVTVTKLRAETRNRIPVQKQDFSLLQNVHTALKSIHFLIQWAPTFLKYGEL